MSNSSEIHACLLSAYEQIVCAGRYAEDGLTPNMTRRAQVANWLLYYRRELRGVSIEELKRRREERRLREEAENKTEKPTGTTKQGVV